MALSFTVETDGRLPSGQTLADAILQVENACDCYPAYYMINRAHPSHLQAALTQPGNDGWRARIRGLRANSSRMSHAELNESTTLDIGDPDELGQDYVFIKKLLPNLNILGGCCGTDHRHVEHIACACAPLFEASFHASSALGA